MAKKKKAGSGRHRRPHTKKAVRHIEKLEAHVQDLRRHLEMKGSDPFNQK